MELLDYSQCMLLMKGKIPISKRLIRLKVKMSKKYRIGWKSSERIGSCSAHPLDEQKRSDRIAI